MVCVKFKPANVLVADPLNKIVWFVLESPITAMSLAPGVPLRLEVQFVAVVPSQIPLVAPVQV